MFTYITFQLTYSRIGLQSSVRLTLRFKLVHLYEDKKAETEKRMPKSIHLARSRPTFELQHKLWLQHARGTSSD